MMSEEELLPGCCCRVLLGSVSGNDHSDPLTQIFPSGSATIWLIGDVKMMMQGKNQVQIQLLPLFNCDLRFAICEMRLTVSLVHVAVRLK